MGSAIGSQSVLNRLNPFLSYISIVVLVLLWQIAALIIDNPLLIPTVPAVVEGFVTMTESGTLQEHFSATLIRTLGGFFLAILVGIPLGLLMGTRGWAKFLLEPIINFGYPIPKVALYPLVLIVVGFGHVPKIILVFLETVIPILIGAYYGVESVNELYIWSAENLGASDREIFFRVSLPASMPYIFSGLRTALPIALIIAIVTEMISSEQGLGYLIEFAAGNLAFDEMFVSFLAIAMVGYVLDRSLLFVRGRVLFWADEVDLTM